ncbi:MAG: DUF6036 family nucleotidyltransferase [Planctomycetota bacterium]
MNFAGHVREVALRLIRLLERDQTPYALMGGIVVPIWGVPRATYDVDVTLLGDAAVVDRFLAAAVADGFVVDPPFTKGFRDRVSGMDKLRIEWWTPESRRVEVDVFLVTTEYQRAAFARRVQARIDHTTAWVIGPADLILHKLVAGRPKDLADIQNVLAVQGSVDAEYVRKWAVRLAVEDRLDTSLRLAGLA